jgi:RNA-directed DNA polymerase
MNRFLKHWRLNGRGEAFRAHVISYADDFVILSCGHAEEALTWTRAVMAKLGLTLNEAKTSVKDARTESFDFLGYSLGPRHYPDSGRRYLGASPSKKSVQRIKAKVSGVLTPGNKGAFAGRANSIEPSLGRLVGVLLLWLPLLGVSSRRDDHVYDRVRSFLCKRIRSQGVARHGSRASMCTQNWACFVFVACAKCLHRVPYDEDSRKAGCGNSVRPV